MITTLVLVNDQGLPMYYVDKIDMLNIDNGFVNIDISMGKGTLIGTCTDTHGNVFQIRVVVKIR